VKKVTQQYPLIVQPEIVRDLLENPDTLIIDVAQPEQYNELHIEGAINLPYTEFVVKQAAMEGAIVEDSKIIEMFSKAGIDRERPIFIYDATNNARASRLLWTLHVFNHANASIIDGAINYWKHKGYPVSQTPHTGKQSEYAIEYGRNAMADKNHVFNEMLAPTQTVLFDVRTVAEYEGKKVVGSAKRAGHIPGAKNLFWKEMFYEDDFCRIKSKEEILDILTAHDVTVEDKMIVYCQSHLRSSHSYVVLKSIGVPDVLGYAGSWSEWGSDSEIPVNISESPPIIDMGNGSHPAYNLLPLITDPQSVADKMSEDNILLVDVALENIYQNGHIPGAVRLQFPSILYQHDNCDCDIPPIKQLSDALSILGLRPEHHVVAYDRQGGPMATRFLWTLEALGHKNYSYLDGGLAGWKSAGFDVSTSDSFKPSTNYICTRKGDGLADKQYILSKLGDPNTSILDTRLEEEFTNELVICDRGGNIPGARHFNWEDAIDTENSSSFRPVEELQTYMDKLNLKKDDEIIVYCQTHTRSAHTFYVLKHLGYPNVLAYPAGYSEWGNETDLPIENEYFGDD
jgi:thiosulfate/3-mercaptopyruvate sulfurtransferase